MASEKGVRKDKNQNIQVFVRLRPLNQRERDIKSLGVVDVLHNREVVVRQSSQTTHTKKFTFDRAFNPNAKQVEVYQEVVSPLIEEVLAGYNCTVFAYGQTGTGKTHTMVGEHTGEDMNWQNDPLAGIIPRALSQLFDELRISNTEYTVRVSYLELYNEELFDLLSSSEDNSKLRIYEDVTRKGANIVNGLEEITVYNKNEVYKIMAQGQERKRVASTLMNAQSSRSHTVFTIVVHMKENSPEGEELVKIGKLNLVDLAGSENISKAGSDNPGKKERARECVNINQSLLTLGRVITALVERHPHVPYRESKLTRILQESLGGRTKTSIIATISPGHKDLEETMSTLEYANRAKNIQNKPEVNQKMTKKAILKEYAEEIDRLKRDLLAAREKSGVYLANETFAELTLQQEEQRKEIQRLLLKKRAMEEEKEKMENVFSDLSKTLEMRISELNATKSKLDNTKTQLANTNNMLRSTKMQYEEQVHLVEKHQATESTLSSQAKQLLATAETATTHVHCLHDSVDRRRHVESSNLQVTSTYREQSAQQREHINSATKEFTDTLVETLTQLHAGLESLTSTNAETLRTNKTAIEQVAHNITRTMEEITSVATSSQASLLQATEAQHSTIKASIEAHHGSVSVALTSLLQSVAGSVLAAEGQNLPENVAAFVNQWYSSAVERVRSLAGSQRGHAARLALAEAARGEHYVSSHDKRRDALQAQLGALRDTIQKLECDKSELRKRTERQLQSLDTERKETETRLQLWVEEERRLFEERLQAHVRRETAVLEERLSKEAAVIEQDCRELEALLSRHLHSQQEQLEACNQQLQVAALDLQHVQEAQQRSQDAANHFTKEFDDDTTAVSIDMEAFSQNVVEVVRHVYSQLLATLREAKAQLEKDAILVEGADKVAGETLLQDTQCAHTQLVELHRENIDTVLKHIQANTTSTMSTLSSLCASSDAVVASADHHAAQHAACVQDVTSRCAHYSRHIREALARHEELEGRCLAEEYKVYCPTGGTPQRTEYRYPRALAATSPHERLLASFRERRNNAPGDEDCIVIEESESAATSDAESTMSEDSAVFAAPSPPALPAPPAPPAPRADKLNGSLKCRSESNIYEDIRRSHEQLPGKENADRSLTTECKRASKLRPPSSHKKPLYDRNTNN